MGGYSEISFLTEFDIYACETDKIVDSGWSRVSTNIDL
jgi:hypothetical protein